MRALVCSEHGPVSRLRVGERPSPTPGEREVVVRVQAAGLNYPDALMVQGKYQVKPPTPYVPGMELAGVVAATGARVDEVRVGDPVMASSGTGAFAEECVVPVERVHRRPEALAPDLAAATLITYGTTLHALEDRARLQSGEWMLVLGAAGGVGTAAVELGKLLGARVIAAASSPAKLEVCRSLGADATIDYAKEDLRQRVQDLTGGKGADVVYDPVGGAYSEAALRSTAWGGRHLVIGFAAGEIPRLPLNLTLLKERAILGAYWGDWSARNRIASAEELQRIAGWIVSGKLRPVITRRLRLEEVPQAMEDLLERRVHGKLVVLPST